MSTLSLQYYESQELNRLIYQLTETAMRKKDKNSDCIYGLDLFWSGIQDGSNFSYVVSSTMLSSLMELLSQPFCKFQWVPFAMRCIENLRQSVSVPQSLIIMRHIIGLYFHFLAYCVGLYGDRMSNDNTEEVIRRLNSSQNLLGLYFDSLSSYTQTVRENATADPCRYILPGTHYSYYNNIKVRLDFLDYIIRKAPIELQTSQVDMLWDNIVLKPAAEEIMDLGFQWFKNCAHHTDGVSHSVSSLYLQMFSIQHFPSRIFVTSSRSKYLLSTSAC